MAPEFPKLTARLAVVRDGDAEGGVTRDIDWSILMARAQAGDAACYRRLLHEITPCLRSLARRRASDPGDCEDAVQDILLTLHAIRQSYDPARPFGPWLVAIANRRLVDQLRRQGRRRSRETPFTADHETYSGDETNLETDIARRQELEAAIKRLSPGEQQAIQMLKLKEMSLKEAATASGMSIGALKVATHRALKKLRGILTSGSDVT